MATKIAKTKIAKTKIAKTKIDRDTDGDYRVKAYGPDGKHLPNLDYYAADKADAVATAKLMEGESAGTVLSALLDEGWTGADAAAANLMDRVNVWGAYNCWSNYPAASTCGRDVVKLWRKLQPFLSELDPSCRAAAVGAFVAGADVLAFG